ncbi:MAG TPA: DUF4124 domain-containing protein [Steroidobacteraceae bacterium]|nr:DUF4124 domain-containing protein [Steroidobacteraceae bacterium]
MRRSLLLLAAATVSLVGAGARADIWKWVDAQGHVQYSDRWTPGAVLIKSEHGALTDDSSSSADAQKSLESTSQQVSAKLNKEAAQRAVQKDEATAQASQCKDAKSHYDQLIEARRIYKTDSSGNRQYLSDDEADQERVQARMDMDKACGSDSP